MHFSVEAHKNQDFIPEASDLETLLVRAEKNAKIAGLGIHYARIKTFRRGPRELGVWKGYEILARKPPFKKDTDAHEFRFRSVGAVNDAYHPELDVQLDSGVRGNRKAAIQPSITDEEAIALWDRLIKSIRIRARADNKTKSNTTSSVPISSVKSRPSRCRSHVIAGSSICQLDGDGQEDSSKDERALYQSLSYAMALDEKIATVKVDQTSTARLG